VWGWGPQFAIRARGADSGVAGRCALRSSNAARSTVDHPLGVGRDLVILASVEVRPSSLYGFANTRSIRSGTGSSGTRVTA
jgi:hypothetical protein